VSEFPFDLNVGLSDAAPPAPVKADAEGDRSLLDQSAQLVDDPLRVGRKRGWRFTYWPGCSEASLAWVEPKREPIGSGRNAEGKRVASGYSGPVDRPLYRPLSEYEIEQRRLHAELNWKIANSRARGRSRRYFVVNRLRFMWVLTFREPPAERSEVMALVAEFARRLRNDVGASVPYWYSPELHPGGHGWHVNLFVPGRLEHAQIANLWGHGFVWVTDFERSPNGPKGEPLGLCRTPREGWRRAAQYGCKYAQKDWEPGAIGPRNHRYEIAQGFSPVPERYWLNHDTEAWELVAELVPEGEWGNLAVWDSNDTDEWNRPPIATFRW
jgi:hypothetical protein